MTISCMTPREYATMWQGMMTSANRTDLVYNGMYDALLKLGVDQRVDGPLEPRWYGLPATPKSCFENAIKSFVRTDGELTYTEGIAVSAPDMPLAVHHAWLTAPDGSVVDPTWGRRSPAATYLGIKFKGDSVLAMFTRLGVYSSVLDAWRDRMRVYTEAGYLEKLMIKEKVT